MTGRGASAAWLARRVSGCLLILMLPALAQAHGMLRRDAAGTDQADSILVPAGAEWLSLGAVLPRTADARAPAGSAARLGDTAAQAFSVLEQIGEHLAEAGFDRGDLVRLDVFLVADPRKGGAVDVAGLASAYLRFFGSDSRALPLRVTVEVAGLPVPGALVQMAATAARLPQHPH